MSWHRQSTIAAILCMILVAVMAWQLRQAKTVQSDTTRALALMAVHDLRDIPAYLDRARDTADDRARLLLHVIPDQARGAGQTLRILGQHLDRRRSESWTAAAIGVDSLARSVVTTGQRLGYLGELPERDQRFLALLGPAVQDLQRAMEHYPDGGAAAVDRAGDALRVLAEGWHRDGVLPGDQPPRGVERDQAVALVQDRFGVDPGLPHTARAAEPNAWLDLWAWQVNTRDVTAMVHMATGRLLWWQEMARADPSPTGDPAVADRSAAVAVARHYLATEGYQGLSTGEAVTGEAAVQARRPREAGNPAALPTLAPRADQWLVRFHRVADGVPVLADWAEVLVDSRTGRVTGFAGLAWLVNLDLSPSLTPAEALVALQDQGHRGAVELDTLAVIRSPYSHQPVLAYRLVGPGVVTYVDAHRGRVELVASSS